MTAPSFLTPHSVVCFIVHLNKKAEYLLLRRTNLNKVWDTFSEEEKIKNKLSFQRILKNVGHIQETWQMVSGGIKEGELAYYAALREVYEETGITPDRFYAADTVEMFYTKTLNRIECSAVFVGFVDKKLPIALSPREHDAYEWLPFDEAKERLIFSEQKRTISHIQEAFVIRDPHIVHRIEIPSDKSVYI